MVRIAIDIDGILGYRNRQQYINTCNEVLKLGVPDDRLQDISLYSRYAAITGYSRYAIARK